MTFDGVSVTSFFSLLVAPSVGPKSMLTVASPTPFSTGHLWRQGGCSHDWPESIVAASPLEH